MEYSQHECTQHSARARAHTGVHAWGMRHLLLLGAQARGHTWSQAEAAYFYPNLLRPLRKDLHVADLGHGGTFRFGLLRSPTRSLKEDTLNRSAMPSHAAPNPARESTTHSLAGCRSWAAGSASLSPGPYAGSWSRMGAHSSLS